MLCATCSDCATSVYYSAVYTPSDRDKKKKVLEVQNDTQQLFGIAPSKKKL